MSETSHLRSESEQHHVYLLCERKQVEAENEQDL